MTELSLRFGGLEGGCVRATLGGLASELPCCQQAWSCGAGACGRSHGHSWQGPRGEALSRDPLPPVCGRGTPGLQACGTDRHPGLFHDLGYLQIQPEPGDRPKGLLLSPAPHIAFFSIGHSMVAMDSMRFCWSSSQSGDRSCNCIMWSREEQGC